MAVSRRGASNACPCGSSLAISASAWISDHTCSRCSPRSPCWLAAFLVRASCSRADLALRVVDEYASSRHVGACFPSVRARSLDAASCRVRGLANTIGAMSARVKHEAKGAARRTAFGIKLGARLLAAVRLGAGGARAFKVRLWREFNRSRGARDSGSRARLWLVTAFLLRANQVITHSGVRLTASV